MSNETWMGRDGITAAGSKIRHAGMGFTKAASLVLLTTLMLGVLQGHAGADSYRVDRESPSTTASTPSRNLKPPGSARDQETFTGDEHPIAVIEALEIQLDPQSEIQPLDLSSPRATLWSMLVMLHSYGAVLEKDGRNYDNEAQLNWIQKRITECFDVEDVAPQFQASTATDAAVRIRSAMIRIPMPAWSSIPDVQALEKMKKDGKVDWYRFKNIPIEMVRIDSGDRSGEWLISPKSRDKAEHVYQRLAKLPPVIGKGDLYKNHFFQTGWMIPSNLITNLPDAAGHQIIGQSIWQWTITLIMGLLITAFIVAGFLYLNHRINRTHKLNQPHTIPHNLGKLVFLVFSGCLMIFFGDFLERQIFLNGTVLETFTVATTLIMALAFVFAGMTLGTLLAQIIIHSPKVNPKGLDAAVIRIISKTISILFALVFSFQILQDLGFAPTTILAGAGVTGLAFALAAQDMLKNFFASVILLIERPFKEGDVIRIDEDYGWIESIGMRSTSIRLKDGNIVYIPNGEVSQGRIENITRRPHIRSTVKVGVTYSTSYEQLKRAMTVLSEILMENVVSPTGRLPVVFFKAFEESSLVLQGMVWHEDTSNMVCKQALSAVNLEILRRFKEEGLEFAFPTITLDVDTNPHEFGDPDDDVPMPEGS